MEKIKSFQEWNSVNEGILDFLKKKKEEKDYIVLPKWEGKNDVEVISKRKPYVSTDYVEFYINDKGIDTIIFHNKNIGDTNISVNVGKNKHSLKLDRKEADRLRNLYFKKK